MSGGGSSVGVVFVNFHSEALVAPRAAALEEAGFVVVVADNSGTYAGPGTVVDPGGNVGFGAGCNAAVAAMAGDTATVLLHNPDVDADPATLGALARRLAGQHRPGVLAPAIEETAGVRAGGFRWPQLRREAPLAVLEATGLQRRRRQGPRRGRPAAADRTPEPAPGTTFGSGALLAVDAAAYREVGGFDERFFLYLEDADLWRRLADAGRTTAFAPDLLVRHASSAGSPMGDLDRAVLRWAGVELFVATHGRRGAWALHRLAHLAPVVVAALRGGRLARSVLGWWVRGWSPGRVSSALRDRHRAADAR